MHTLATSTEGRPVGGLSCFIKSKMGTIKEIIKEENMVVVKTPEITLIAMYMNQQATAEKVVEKNHISGRTHRTGLE